jgi:2-methylisocitrate lyase-like PEP mutase family enzyme
MPTSIPERRATFRRLHDEGCFIIPNPWDIGSTWYLQSLGFKALATTSSGAAFSLARPDGGMSLDEVLAHIRTIVEATDLPVNADFEDGHAADEDTLSENVRLCIETGVAGLSIEDSTGDKARPLYDMAEAIARMRAARMAIDEAGGEVMLIGRAECFLTGHPEPLKESMRRLVAYAEAGADCLYAPGLRTREEIEAVVQAVAPKPVNVLIGRPIGFTLEDLADMGVRRVSVGGALSLAAWGGFMRAAKALTEGSFAGFEDNAAGRDLNAFFDGASA